MPTRPRRATFTSAARELATRDPVIARLVELDGLPRLRARADSHFAALVRSIVFQQLAGAAAAAIHGRVVTALKGDVTPAAVVATPPAVLRGAGLSAAKEASLRDLAVKVEEGTVVLDPRGLARESDDEVVTRLSTVRGIGRWTAEMFLLFQLRRLDVWPTGDLGVRRGYGLAWGIPMPSPKELEQLGDPFRPYRSIAAWYCWRTVALERSGTGLFVAPGGPVGPGTPTTDGPARGRGRPSPDGDRPARTRPRAPSSPKGTGRAPRGRPTA